MNNLKQDMTSREQKHFANKVTVRCVNCEIKECSVLKNCSTECLESISDSKHVHFFLKGQRILLEGNPSKGIYFIKSGKVKIYKSDVIGSEQILRFAKAGDMLGLSTINGDKDGKISAMAISDVMLCQIRNDTFTEIIKKFPELTFELLSMLTCELQRSDDRFVKLASYSVKKRVVDSLLIIFEMEGESESFHLNLSRQEIANLACTTKEQVSKIFAELQSQKLISIAAKQVEILDIDKLRKLAM